MAMRRSFGQLFRSSSSLLSCRKYSVAQEKLVDVSVDDKSGVATATLQRPPINALSLELLTQISNACLDLEKSKVRGLILTSSSSSVFSAGLDIQEMYKPDLERFKKFWTALQETFINLYGSSYPTVALINGHAPAGGCVLSLSCEYRIMLPNFTIGLNETQLGIMPPQWFIAPMQATIGERQAELALTAGRMFKTDEALNVGLVDEIAANKEDGLVKAEKFLARFHRIPPLPRAYTKQRIRGKTIQDLVTIRQRDLDEVVTFITQPKVQKGLEFYLESLKQKRQ